MTWRRCENYLRRRKLWKKLQVGSDVESEVIRDIDNEGSDIADDDHGDCVPAIDEEE